MIHALHSRALVLALVCACGGHDAHTTTVPVASASSVPPAAQTREEHCRDAARACGAALVTGTDDKIIDCMADAALAFVGGRKKVADELSTGKVNMAHDGWAFEHVDIDAPREVVSAGSQLFAIVPQKVTLKTPMGHLLQRGYLLGVSTDAGQTWKFVDGAGLTEKNTKQMFPDFPASIVLPELTKPEQLP